MNLNISAGVAGCAGCGPNAATAFWFHNRQAAFAFATHVFGLVAAGAAADAITADPTAKTIATLTHAN
jgi:hypothetical protein